MRRLVTKYSRVYCKTICCTSSFRNVVQVWFLLVSCCNLDKGDQIRHPVQCACCTFLNNYFLPPAKSAFFKWSGSSNLQQTLTADCENIFSSSKVGATSATSGILTGALTRKITCTIFFPEKVNVAKTLSNLDKNICYKFDRERKMYIITKLESSVTTILLIVWYRYN